MTAAINDAEPASPNAAGSCANNVAANKVLDPVVRIYVNVDASRVGEALVPILDALPEHFMLKAPLRGPSYARQDPVVVYLNPSDLVGAAPRLADGLLAASEFTRRSLPPMVFPLVHGIGLAESPADGSSFGDHRCRALARAVCIGLSECDVAATADIDAERPYRTAASTALDTIEGLFR
jgi:HopA1 effector protein family